MGMGQNLLIFVVIAALLLSITGLSATNSTSNTIAGFIGINTSTGQPTQTGSLQTTFMLTLGVGAIALGTFFFPNPYTLFAFLASLLLTLGSIYWNLMNDVAMPFPVQLVIGGVLVLTMVLTAIGFLKGGEW